MEHREEVLKVILKRNKKEGECNKKYSSYVYEIVK